MFTEKDASILFKNIVPKDYFHVHHQQKGYPKYVKKLKRIFSEWSNKNVPQKGIIDYVLEPTDKLIDFGWEIGCVGVEIKSSFALGSMAGRAIVQTLDYQSCVYKINDKQTELSMIFLFPFRETSKEIASIMQQEGIGFVRYFHQYDNTFELLQANTSHEIVFRHNNKDQIEIRRPRYGKKFGHR